jgi:hypothetical protein
MAKLQVETIEITLQGPFSVMAVETFEKGDGAMIVGIAATGERVKFYCASPNGTKAGDRIVGRVAFTRSGGLALKEVQKAAA